MIKFGETYTCVEDPHGMFRSMMERWLSSGFRCPLTSPQAHVTQRGSNLLYLNYPPLPPAEINRLVIPTGATRWSYTYLLATTTMKDAIYAEAAGSSLVLEYRTEKRKTVIEADETIKLTMWPLTALPISAEDVNENRDLSEPAAGVPNDGVWLIPLVDARYWWQFANVDAISEEPIETAADLLTYLISNATSAIAVQTLNADYNYTPDVLDNNSETFAVLLDSVAWQLGLTLVPRMEGTGDGYALLDSVASAFIYGGNIIGSGGINSTSQTGVPQQVAGDNFERIALPASVKVQRNATEFETYLASSLGYSFDTVPDTQVVLRYRWIDDIGARSDITERIARDYYNRFLVRYDKTFLGQQNWQPTSYTDCVIHEMQPAPLTRIRSLPLNLYPELPGGGSGTSTNGQYFWFTVVDRICDEDVDPYVEPVAGLIVEPTILSGTELPEPVRDDGNYLVQDPCNLMGPYNYAQTSSGNKGKTSLGYVVGGSEPFWVLDWLEVYPDCGSSGGTTNPL